MDSRTTERPITRVPSSIAPIASAGTSRRPRRKPERTASASGTSGWVPYIGASTRPTNRPRASATMKPFTLRRSKATLLIAENLFPVDEVSPARQVRSLLIPGAYNRAMYASAWHLRLLTETIAAVNSTLDLEEVLALVATEVADALGADACFVYLYDERADELVLRATHGTSVEEMTRRPRLRPGEGITGSAAAERAPIAIAARAHLDSRFKLFPNLPEDEYESILAVPILARRELEGALNVRTREPREHSEAEIDLLVAIASQVAQSIQHARLYADAQRRVHELEALASIS